MALSALSVGVLPTQTADVAISLDRISRYSTVSQSSNRGGFASCSQAHGPQSMTYSQSRSHKTRDFTMQAAAVLEPEVAAPDSAKPSSAGKTSLLLVANRPPVGALPDRRGHSLIGGIVLAEVARTIVDLMTHGALSTVGEDNIPLGTYASYVLDSQGQPILRLREGAVHTANLLRNPQCSLFIQPDDMPARILARLIIFGWVINDQHLHSMHHQPSGPLSCQPD